MKKSEKPCMVAASGEVATMQGFSYCARKHSAERMSEDVLSALCSLESLVRLG